MMFSVIIPTCNRNDLLEKCLALLDAACRKAGNSACEIIVTDDGNANQAKLLVEQQYPGVVWVAGPKKGPAANRNNGAKKAKGDWLVFIDDDCLPGENIIVEYQQAIALHPEAGAFEGSIWPDDESLLKKDLTECPVNKTGGYFWTANVCVNTMVFKQVNGFDEDFLIAAQEDQLLYLRLKAITTVVFVPDARVIHPVRFISFWKKIRNDNKSLQNWLLFTQKRGMPYLVAVKELSKGLLKAFIQNAKSLRIQHSLLNAYTAVVGLPRLTLQQIIKGRKKG